MKKSNLKRLQEVHVIGLKASIDTDQHPWQVMFLMKALILEQQQRLDELEYKIAELRGEVEPEEE